MNQTRLLTALAATTVFATSAQAQIQTIATESFDYAFPSVLDGNGGTGFSTPWGPSPGGPGCVVGQHSYCPAGVDDLVIQANPPVHTNNPFPWPEADSVGNYAQQANEFGRWIRGIDLTGHNDVVENGAFGKDGSTIWVSFTIKIFTSSGIHDGGIFLSQAGVWECEPGNTAVLLGTPWGSSQWGMDWNVGYGGQSFVANTFDTITTRYVVRLDYVAGADRIRVWLDPAVPHPTGVADLDVTVPEERPWNELRMSSGGSGSLAYWDNIVIEKGDPMGGGIGTNYCLSLPNSSGLPALISAVGSESVAVQNLELRADFLPPSVSGIFYYGTNNPLIAFGDGFRCVAGITQRLPFNQADASGLMSQPGVFQLNMPNLPITAGSTLYFQAWYRDAAAMNTGFNFSDGVQINFVP